MTSLFFKINGKKCISYLAIQKQFLDQFLQQAGRPVQTSG